MGFEKIPDDDGKKEQPCKECGGKGKTSDGKKCEACDGSGQG